MARRAVASWLEAPEVAITLVEAAYGSRAFALADLASDRVTHVGVRATTLAWSKECLINLGLARLPSHAGWGQMFGVCVLCGIGFTMSLFIGSLAFAGLGAQFETELKIGVLCASVLAGLLGALWLLRYPRQAA